MKILIIGDTHFKDSLSYADYISDRREGEKKKVLDFLIESSKDCDHIVFLGDLFNSKNNSSEVNRQVVELLERFGNKDIYIISGNHEKKGDGKTAIDFLREIKKKNWNIFTQISSITMGKKKVTFLPYILNSELEVMNYENATKEILHQLEGGDILLAHHAISGTLWNGISTDLFKEVVLPRAKLEEKYTLVVAGHIHEPQQQGNTLIAGSLFTSEVGETEKYIFKIDEDLNLEKLKVPTREIHKVENPTAKQLSNIPGSAIVKVVIKDKKISIETLKEQLSRFDAFLIIENYPNERKKVHIEEGAFDFNIESLLKLYSEEKKVDYQKLINGLRIIND